MPHITQAAYKAWQESFSRLPFEVFLEQQKAAGKYWVA